jgi:hypothetical protein
MSYAHLSLATIDLLIATDEALLAMVAREHKGYVDPASVAAYRRIEQAQAEKRARADGSIWRKDR